jgi:hypothetical protein
VSVYHQSVVFIIIFCIFIAIKWFFRRQKPQAAADYHDLLVFDNSTALCPDFLCPTRELIGRKNGGGGRNEKISIFEVKSGLR